MTNPHQALIIVARMQSGEQAAVGELYDLYGGMIYALALRLVGNMAEAEEIVLATFTQAWRQAHRYPPACQDVAAWLIVLARDCGLPIQKHLTSLSTGALNLTC